MNKIIEIAQKEIGVTENPPDSNKTKYGKWFGLDGVAWCGIFVSWCYANAGKPLGNIGFLKGFAGCSTMFLHATKKKWLTAEPVEADIVLFDWNGDKRYDHTGLFVKWLDRKKGMFESIEGNTSLTNQSNGGQVMRRERDVKYSIFIHPLV